MVGASKAKETEFTRAVDNEEGKSECVKEFRVGVWLDVEQRCRIRIDVGPFIASKIWKILADS